MFFRLALSILLIATGIASPWLVRDWLATPQSERNVESMVEKAMDYPRGWWRWFRPDVSETVVEHDSGASLPGEIPGSAEMGEGTGLEGRPYPLVLSTARVLRGILPGMEDRAVEFGSPSSKPTSFSKSVVKETATKIEAELHRLGMTAGSPIFVRIFKEEKELEIWIRNEGEDHFSLFKVYRLRDVSGKPGPKVREGDRQAPEGFYYVSRSRMRPGTSRHLGMDLGFPNDYDRARDRTGSEILIHGGTSSNGSFVLSPEDMNEVFTLADLALREGQKYFRVHSFPFRMTDSRMEKEWKRQPKWIDFWVNLKEGYDFFENANFPPHVEPGDGEYSFRFPSS